MAMPTMGPRMTALGEMDFMSAQMSAERQMTPRSGQLRWPAVITTTPNAARTLPANGSLRLWRKLPRTISTAAHRLPSTAARCQTWRSLPRSVIARRF